MRVPCFESADASRSTCRNALAEAIAATRTAVETIATAKPETVASRTAASLGSVSFGFQPTIQDILTASGWVVFQTPTGRGRKLLQAGTPDTIVVSVNEPSAESQKIAAHRKLQTACAQLRAELGVDADVAHAHATLVTLGQMFSDQSVFSLNAPCGKPSLEVTAESSAKVMIKCEPGEPKCDHEVQALEANHAADNITVNQYPPSPPEPPSRPPGQPPPSPPPSPSPPPVAVQCGCRQTLNDAVSATEAVCIKPSTRVCTPAALHKGVQGRFYCPSDMDVCVSGQGIDVYGRPCSDTPGRWAVRKCTRKAQKGKCHKRKVIMNCAATCGACV